MMYNATDTKLNLGCIVNTEIVKKHGVVKKLWLCKDNRSKMYNVMGLYFDWNGKAKGWSTIIETDSLKVARNFIRDWA